MYTCTSPVQKRHKSYSRTRIRAKSGVARERLSDGATERWVEQASERKGPEVCDHRSESASFNSQIPEFQPELNTPEGTPVQPGKNSRIPIIALIAYAMDGDRERFLETGMNDYLAKPVHKEDLERVLNKYCE